MLEGAKAWFVNHVWNAFSMDKWKKRSQTFSVIIGVAFILSVVAIMVSIYTQFSVRQWSDSASAVVLVPRDRVVQINGASYIPIKML